MPTKVTDNTQSIPGEPRSRKGRTLYRENVLTPLEQIPVRTTSPVAFSVDDGKGQSLVISNVDSKSVDSFAYFLRPDGATIAEVLILYPNGGRPKNPKDAAKFGVNAEYYRNRQAQKGFEFVGSYLTADGVRRLVEILAENREDEILFCEDEVVNARHAATNSDRPEVRDLERKRAAQFERRLDYLRQPLDPDALISELNDIARAQQLADVDPNILAVMRSMIGEVNEKMAAAIAHFQQGPGQGEGDGGFVGAKSLDA